MWVYDITDAPIADKFLYGAMVPVNAYTSVSNFNFLAELVLEI